MRKLAIWTILIIAYLNAGIGASRTRAADGFDYKFKDDWFIDVMHNGTQQISVLGNNTQNTSMIHMVAKVHVVKSDDSGTELEHTVVAEDDVITNGPNPAMKDVFKGMRGQKFTVRLKPHNEQIDFDVDPAVAAAVFPNEMQNGNAAQKKMIQDMLTYILRVHIGEFYMPTPATPVADGTAWPHKMEMTLQSIAKIKSDRDYKSTGDSVQWTGKLAASPAEGEPGAVPFKVLEVGLVGDPVDTGTVTWDRAAGRPSKVESKQEADMKMKYDINGQKVDAAAKSSDSFIWKAMEKYENPQ